ncbi:P-loop containing nucleoside triphosphate hydrolase protein [Dissophora ornata]|nr:P-loop containing nucleoside triphosphate hydrolase protein [Dissophora ornata]
MKDAKVQTQLSFKNHSGNTDAFQREQQQRHSAVALTDCHKCLRSVFKLKEFRGEQLAVVQSVLEGRDALVIMPTGGGKSLCYQLPAVMSKGITIVVSPLLALIHDQASALSRLGIKAAALNSSISKKGRTGVIKDLELMTPSIKLLYVTPELLATSEFRKRVAALQGRDMVARLVIDEAHCISEWGHDFRKDYVKLDYFRIAFPKLPIIALTATATERVRQDIKTTLGLPDPPNLCLFISSFNRGNLFYEVRFDNNDRYENFLGFLKGVYKSRRKRLWEESESAKLESPSFVASSTVVQSSSSFSLARLPESASKSPVASLKVEAVCGIIYCGQRLTCEDLASRLIGDGIMAAAFHSGMTPKQRASVQRRWCSDASTNANKNSDEDEKPIDVIVATIAFGMGIDKPNVRFVCHWELPKTIEGYYQESGRAGRDGDISRCILYYSREDRAKVEFLLEAEKERRRLRKEKHAPESSSSKRARAIDPIQNFQKMVAYCENVTQCRHVFLCEYFGEKDVKKQDVCKDGARCDICRTPEKVMKEKAEKLSDIQGVGRHAQYMGGSKTFVGSDGTVQVQGLWQSASVALDRYDADLIGDDSSNEDDDDDSNSDSSDRDSKGSNSRIEDHDEDYDSEAERKAKRRKILFGKEVDVSYYKKAEVTLSSLQESAAVQAANKYGLTHSESVKVPLKFRELCYETIERSLAGLFQGSHKSLATDYFSRVGGDGSPEPLSKSELDAKYDLETENT